MIPANNWRQRYTDEVRKNTIIYEQKNKQAKVITRQMTEDEYQRFFGQQKESCHKLKINNRSVTMQIKILLDTVPKVQKFVRIVSGLSNEAVVESGRYRVNACSLIGLFSLDLSKTVILVINEDDYEVAKGLLSEFEVEECKLN